MSHPRSATTRLAWIAFAAVFALGLAWATTSLRQARDRQPPTVPKNLVATALSSTQVHLGWQASTDNQGVAKYQIYRVGRAGPIGETTETVYDDLSAQANTRYSYFVKAVDTSNNVSRASNRATVVTPSSQVVAPTITSQPANVTASSGSSASFTVEASGSAPLSYVWRRGSTVISACTSATCLLSSVTSADAGSYTVQVSNSAGSATSNPATLTVTPGSGGTVITAASCRVEDIKAAVALAPSGGIVQIPAGPKCVWPGKLDMVTVNKSLWIRGAGSGQTVIQRGAYIDIDNTSENDIALTALFSFDCNASTRVRFSGMTLLGNGKEGSFVGSDDVVFPQLLAFDYGIKLWACRDFRIHDTRFEKFGYAGIDLRSRTLQGNAGILRGLIDHNEFIGNMKVGLGYGVAVSGNDDWPAPDYGSANNVFVEDNHFEDNRHNIAAGYGARYVFRYNSMVTTYRARWWGMVDAHGKADGGHGTRAFEVYNNSFEMTGIPAPASATGALFRGGDGVFFNNIIHLGLSWAPGNPPYGIILTVENEACEANPGPAYPANDQTTDLYLWGNSNNNVSLGGDNWTDCAKYFKLGRDFHIQPRPGYTPYVYPHPLQAQAWPTP